MCAVMPVGLAVGVVRLFFQEGMPAVGACAGGSGPINYAFDSD